MTPEAIRAMIQANQSLRDMINIGNDSGAAEAITASLPPVATGQFITDRDMYYHFGPSAVETFLGKLSAYVASGSTNNHKIVGRLLTWLKPSEGGINLHDPGTISVFNALATGGIITAGENSALQSMALKQDIVTTQQVSDAVAIWRPNGKIAPVPV